MFSQIDDRASSYLEYYLACNGIHLRINERVSRIVGERKVQSVMLASGETLECDTVILAAGIEPNVELALKSGISISRGIRINEKLQTTKPHIYAIGECAEYEGQLYGLVGPGYEQSSVLAMNLSGQQADYHGSMTATQLKVLDYPVLSIGETGVDRPVDELIYQDENQQIYRKLVVINGRLRGVVAVGEWPARNRLQETVEKQRYLWPWQRTRFLAEGDLWPAEEAASVIEWPATAIVCQCTGVTRGALTHALGAGHDNVEKLCQATGASSVCGSCVPLLQDLTDSAAPRPAIKYRPAILISAVLGLLSSLLLLFAPPTALLDTVQGLQWDRLWRDGLIKQISGFSLLGLSVLVLILSLRKRIRRFSLGDFAAWRVLHVIVGLLILLTVYLHTGFRMGSELNFYLMLSFSGLLLVGAIVSGVLAWEHQLPRHLATRLRSVSIWAHILLFWPIPVLLGFHVLKSYYY
jgi:nitrite reductase (NADH) large subunit